MAIMAKLAPQEHPGIVKFLEAYQDEKVFLIIMELVPGGTLYERVVKKTLRSDERDIAFIIKQLMVVLNVLNAASVLHRDIKLENIFMMSRDITDVRIKVGDFDLASLSTAVNHTRQCGTPGYMAPEVFYKQFGGYSTKTDVFSSGIVLFALVAGTFPFKARDAKELYEHNRDCRFDWKLIPATVSRECTILTPQ